MKEFVLNLMGVAEHHEETNSSLRFWFQHIRENALKDDGDIFEFGVFRGGSLIAAALILKELGSSKTVYGFDSFSGFPSFSEQDSLENFYKYKGTYFDEGIINDFEKLKNIKGLAADKKVFDEVSISTAGNFDQTSKNIVMEKIEFFELTNVKLIPGPFSETVRKFFEENKPRVSSANIDCDLYEGYKTCLPALYKHLSVNGFIHLDEYYSLKYPGARIACEEFCKEQNIVPKKNATRIGEFERWYLTK